MVDKRLFALQLIVVLVALAANACVEPNPAEHDDSGWVTEDSLGELVAHPATIAFDNVAVGEAGTATVEIENVGLGDAKIVDLQIEEDSGEGRDGQREFFLIDAEESRSVTLPPGGVREVSIEYERLDNSGDDGDLIITASHTKEGVLEVPLEAPAVTPNIDTPESLEFRRIPPSDDPSWRGAWQLLEVTNSGLGILRIDDIHVEQSDRFDVTFPQGDANEPSEPSDDAVSPPGELAPAQSVAVRVWYRPDDNVVDSGRLVFLTNDPDEPAHIVHLNPTAERPCLEVTPHEGVDFGEVAVGQNSLREVTLENCSSSRPLELLRVVLGDDAAGAFSMHANGLPESFRQEPVVLEPGERRSVDVLVEPERAGALGAELRVAFDPESVDGSSIPLSADAVDYGSCPQARAVGSITPGSRQATDIQADPLRTIQLDGSGSFDPDGTIARYEWSVLSRPPGSTQRLLPSAGSVSPRIFLDLAGSYEFELVVYDDEGNRSCGERAVVTVNAFGSEDVHVQLVWDTPQDPDQTDNFGTDLDLHYLHANGQWNQAPWDIFSRNPTANWGVLNDVADDPALDIDDTDGAGPENINHSGLENLDYHVGVYHYSDAALGESYATVRVYIRGQLALELQNKRMARTGQFWDVATIHWPSATVDAVDRIYDGFP